MTPLSAEIPWGQGSTTRGPMPWTHSSTLSVSTSSPDQEEAQDGRGSEGAACCDSLYAIFTGRGGVGSAGKFRRGRKRDRSPQRNTNKRENLAHWRYIFFVCKRIRVNDLNHFCMSLFSNLHKAFPRQFAGPFDSRGTLRQWRWPAPPVRPLGFAR